MSRGKQGFWRYLLVGSPHDEHKEMVLEYVIHRLKAGARLGEVLEEEYVRRHASKEDLDELICNPKLVHAARVHLESALELETSQPRSPSRSPSPSR
jgi:hypothetical protein